jgi:UDP-N-acetylglucosamine 2-epimerase (non-hydrolysing)
VLRAGQRVGVEQLVVHTGQHYDTLMSSSFFDDLGITPPDHNLEVGSGTHAAQTARIMERFEPVLVQHRPDWLVVYGDVNSTMATALVAAKLGIRIAHVEAGLRSGDRAMPEEINRIDSLLHALPHARATGAAQRLGADGSHVLVTLHRPSNVDDDTRLRAILDALAAISRTRRVLFPSHPRTAQRIERLGCSLDGVELLAPLPYHEMVDVMTRAHAVVTDSGGIQEETTALGVPCFTVRENTERPITITEGTNQLVRDPATLPGLVESVRRPTHPPRPEGWDGCAGDRVIQALLRS